jgi:hypothetical protein
MPSGSRGKGSLNGVARLEAPCSVDLSVTRTRPEDLIDSMSAGTVSLYDVSNLALKPWRRKPYQKS